MAYSRTLEELLNYPSGYFRHERAAKYPADSRNAYAAELMDKIAEQLAPYEGTALHARIEDLEDKLASLAGYEAFAETVNEITMDVGFRNDIETADHFLCALISSLEWRLERALASIEADAELAGAE